ncbi:MAG: beta-lactamase family protein [Treponema sp.]|nr:beta-lactamase family protein [Treponema sp.]
MLFTNGKTDCKPHEVGYNEGRIDVLNNHLQRLMDDGEIQCATYCISRKGRIFAHGGVGKKSFRTNDNTPVQADSVRWIASITKVFTAVAIMKLAEDGLTRLDVPVGEILPQFNTPPYNGVTLFQLLTHTSGMHSDGGCFDNKYQTNYWKLIEDAYKLCAEDKKKEFDWISAALGTIGNGFRIKPDTEWAYCSFGFVILGAVIEKLTGIHANKYIEDYICKPLGMKDTAFDLTPEMAKRYIVTDEDAEKHLNDVINGKPIEPHWIGDTLNIPSTGGGLDSTSYDVNRFGNMMLFNGTLDGVRILGRKAVEKMTSIAVDYPNYCWGANEKNRFYGVGFDMRNGPAFTFSDGTYMHEGAGACSLYIDPKEELVAAWIVPFAKEGWFSRALFNVQNIIWSGIL